MEKIIRLASQNNIQVLMYLNPQNFKDGLKFVGPKFQKRFDKNINVIVDFFKKRKVHYLNLAKNFKEDMFIDKRFACDGKRCDCSCLNGCGCEACRFMMCVVLEICCCS